MAASNISIVRPPIDAVDWGGLAGLMRIPNDQREHFIWWLQNSVNGEWCYVTKAPKKPAAWDWAKIDTDIARTGRAYLSAIERRGAHLTATDREILKRNGEYLDKHVRARRRGAPRQDQRRTDRFASFLEDLLYIAWGLGGRPSFTRKTMSGNVVDLMNALRPIMPPDFIPKKVSDRRGERLPRESLIERLVPRTRRRTNPRVGVARADLIEALRGDLWRSMGEQEPACPYCGQPLHWRVRFPISRPSALSRQLPRGRGSMGEQEPACPDCGRGS